jgi:hypothetical protein
VPEAMWAFGITWRPSFVVCHLLTFQILIFFETHQPNELKLSKKYLMVINVVFKFGPVELMVGNRS